MGPVTKSRKKLSVMRHRRVDVGLVLEVRKPVVLLFSIVGVFLRGRYEGRAEDSRLNSRPANISAPVMSSFLSDVDARSYFRDRRFRSRHDVPKAGHTPYDIFWHGYRMLSWW